LLIQQEKRIENLIKFGGILYYFELKKMLKSGAYLMVAAAGWGRERERESVTKATILIRNFTTVVNSALQKGYFGVVEIYDISMT
jgi:hypothetical protein